MQRNSKGSLVLEPEDGPVSIADVSTLSRVARMSDDSHELRQRMVERLDGWSRQVGEILVKPPEDRCFADPDLREAAETIERSVGSKQDRGL